MSAVPFFPASAQQTVKTMVIVDSSRSMWQRVDRVRKYTSVTSSLDRLLVSPPNNNPIGILTFGRKSRRSCKDVEILKPVTESLSEEHRKTLKRLRPRGRSPISLAMQTAVKSLDHENNPIRIVLVVDGPDNCRQDPCETLKELRHTAYDMSVQLVGYGLRKKDIKHYQCFSEHKSDAFYNTTSQEELLTALFIAMGGKHNESSRFNYKPPEVNQKQINSLLEGASRVKLLAILAEGSPVLRQGLSWKIYKALNDSSFRGLPIATSEDAQPEITLKPGNYIAEVTYGDARTEQAILVPRSGLLSHVVNLNAGLLKVETRERDGGETLDGVFYAVYELDEKGEPSKQPAARSTRSISSFYLKEGKYLLRATQGGYSIEKEISIEPAGETSHTLFMNIGTLKLQTVPSANAEPLDRIFYSIYKSSGETGPENLKSGNEAMRTGAAQPELKLPAGKYIVKAEHDLAYAWQTIEVKSGEITSQTINLKAGILNLRSHIKGRKKPLYDNVSYRIHRLKKGNINSSKEIARTSEAQKSYILTPGKYRIVGRYGTINASEAVEIKLQPGSKQTVSITHNAGQAELALIDKKGGFPRIDVFWLIYNKDGQEIWRTSQPTPELVLQAGQYKAVAESNDKRFEKTFTVKNDKMSEIRLQTDE